MARKWKPSKPFRSRLPQLFLSSRFNHFPAPPPKPPQPACYPEIERTLLARGGAAAGVPCSTGRERAGSCLEQRPEIGFVPPSPPRTRLASFCIPSRGPNLGFVPQLRICRCGRGHGSGPELASFRNKLGRRRAGGEQLRARIGFVPQKAGGNAGTDGTAPGAMPRIGVLRLRSRRRDGWRSQILRAPRRRN